jgi:signal transduction histidine kinase
MAVTGEMTRALGFAPSLRLDGSLKDTIPGQAGDDMLLALREALSNTARHAEASKVEVTVTGGTDLVLVVQDNGAGLRQATRRSGLANLRHRAEALGGKLLLGQAEGGGTRLEWRVPLPAAD